MPSPVSEVTGGLGCVAAAMQPDTVEGYIKNRRDKCEERTPDWYKWDERLKNCRDMRERAREKQRQKEQEEKSK